MRREVVRRKVTASKRGIAVEYVSFVADDGRITAMLGPNGAGKTTTLRIIGTLVRADRGQARVGEIDVQTDTRAVRAQLGVLSDARGLYIRLTARENIEYYAQLRKVPSPLGSERLAKMAELLDMGSLLERRVEGFSTGERLKVALARALIHDPHIVLDERPRLDVVSTAAAAGGCSIFATRQVIVIRRTYARGRKMETKSCRARGRTGERTANRSHEAAPNRWKKAFVKLDTKRTGHRE